MAQKGIARITIRRQRGKLCVIAMGQTARGRKYIKNEVAIAAKSTADPAYKREVEQAVDALFGNDPGVPV